MHHRMLLLVVAALASACPMPASGETSPTFNYDVAQVVHGKCASCHRPDSSGPFSLITYRDVKRRAATIEAVLDVGYMPPWKPVDHGIKFANSRRLTKSEEQTLRDWIAADCPEGDPQKAPETPSYDSGGWVLGEPDLVVKMNGQYLVPADGPDIYRSFVFPVNLPVDKWVKAVELQPQAKSALHHALFFVDTTGTVRKLDGADGEAGIEGMGFLGNFGGDVQVSNNNTTLPSSGTSLLNRLRSAKPAPTEDDRAYRISKSLARGLGGYVPGTTPHLLPGDLAMPLPKGSDIVMQTHFHPSGKNEVEQAEIALYFADTPPSKRIVPVMVPPMFGFGAGISIPANERNYRISDSIDLPIATQAIGVSGHAHYICREMKLTATPPDGEPIVLLHIDDWDLDWQDQYWFAEPVDLPAGTVLHAELVYDNSADNPENPHHPPQPIRWGRGSNDEMGSLSLLTIAQQEKDRPVLQAKLRTHFLDTLVHRRGPELVKLLMQLDDDCDGKLQRSEAPPSLDTKTFEFIDADNDKGIDFAEFERVIKLRDRFRDGGTNRELSQALVDLLDHNGDKMLQLSEAPPQFGPIFRFADANQDSGLDISELERVMALRPRSNSGGN